MARFRVLATMETDLECFIEADSQEEAWDIARDTDGAEFTEVESGGSWTVYDVMEV